MARSCRWFVVAVILTGSGRAWACEPVLPFVQTMVPITLSGSFLMLAVAVIVKCALFAFFEKRLPRVRVAWRMFLGNILTSFVGILVAMFVGGVPAFAPVGLPLAFLLCWLPSRRLVKTAPTTWLGKTKPWNIAFAMSAALLGSCILFQAGRGAIETHQLSEYWMIKLSAIFLALLASMTLTTIWEEWVIWRLSSRPGGSGFYASVLRTNMYVLLLVMAMPAAIILPKRLKAPDFLVKRTNSTIAQQHVACTAKGIHQ